MLRTSLSENQYDPRFMIAAKTKAMTSPLASAQQFAQREQHAAHQAEEQHRLDTVCHISILPLNG